MCVEQSALLRRGGAHGLYFITDILWVACSGHEDICTQRSSRDVATAAYLSHCKSR